MSRVDLANQAPQEPQERNTNLSRQRVALLIIIIIIIIFFRLSPSLIAPQQSRTVRISSVAARKSGARDMAKNWRREKRIRSAILAALQRRLSGD
jgi:hypothetical protein